MSTVSSLSGVSVVLIFHSSVTFSLEFTTGLMIRQSAVFLGVFYRNHSAQLAPITLSSALSAWKPVSNVEDYGVFPYNCLAALMWVSNHFRNRDSFHRRGM